MQYPQQITVTEDHVKLLQQMWMGWDGDAYYGAPAVNLKRPYGNSDVLNDVAEILDWEFVKDRWGDKILTEEQAEAAQKIHEETAVVLQILVQYPCNFSPGTYRKVTTYGNEYEKVND